MSIEYIDTSNATLEIYNTLLQFGIHTRFEILKLILYDTLLEGRYSSTHAEKELMKLVDHLKEKETQWPAKIMT